MELERGTGNALWRQIQKALEQDMFEGVLSPGDKLPSERELSVRFGVNRHTLRQALASLVRKNLVRAEQGRGYFLREEVLHYTLTHRVRFRENLLRQRRVAHERLLGFEVVEAGRDVADALLLRPGEQVVLMRTLGSADGHPLCLTFHYFPHALFPDMGTAYARTFSVTAAFRDLGVVDYTRAHTLIAARMPSAMEARLLEQPRSKPVLELESVNVDATGTPIEYGRCLWAADKVQFVVDA